MKLALFDIDGTLVLTGGAGKRAMNRAFVEICGVQHALADIPVAGRTDRAIVRDALERFAIEQQLDDAWLSRFREVYCRLLEEEMSDEALATGPKQVLPGVQALLGQLASRDDVVLALLTGNFTRSARIKLSYFGLWDYFRFGAFGDAHVDRNLLLNVALEAASGNAPMGPPVQGVYVIGDTPHDVACARFGGARAIGVATGMNSAAELRESGADVVFDDLSNVREVLAVGFGIQD